MKSIINVIRERHSVRSYDGHALTEAERILLENAVSEATDPFGGNVTIRLRRFDIKGPSRPGTYGVINGAVDYFLIAFGEDVASQLSAGFRFEKVVLRATEMGLGTCWIAATFKGTDFDRSEEWPDGQSLKIICPVGYPAGKQRFMEKTFRFIAGSNKRKPFGELFFEGKQGVSLQADNTFSTSLEMMRLAPSETNSQPWRAIVLGDDVHFFFERKYALSELDCGIGLCHFFLTESEEGREGHFYFSNELLDVPRKWIYLRSYRRRY